MWSWSRNRWTIYPPFFYWAHSGASVDPATSSLSSCWCISLLGALILLHNYKYACPGLSLERTPLFVWSVYVTAFYYFFHFLSWRCDYNALTDRNFNTSFLIHLVAEIQFYFQHPFCFLDIQKLYFNFTGFGIISHVVSALSTIYFRFLGMIYAWLVQVFRFYCLAHHMYTVGMDVIHVLIYCSYNVIAIPTVLKSLVASNFVGCIIRISTPLLFAVGLYYYLQ